MSKKFLVLLKILLIVGVFWILDFTLHVTGVGETHYYYLSKLANSILFATLWCTAFSYRESWKKLVYSFIFGTWISFYYLVSAYGTGFVQWLGITALYAPPPFVIFGITLAPFFWWVFHALAFYLGLEISQIIKK